MNWFERITGFREGGYAETRARLGVVAGHLHADGRDTGFRVGQLEIASLAALRRRVARVPRNGDLRAHIVHGDVTDLHRQERNAGAVFQATSGFNLLALPTPEATPEDGVSHYDQLSTQGAACALAAGAGAIFRNYLVDIGTGSGQTADRQIDCLAGLGAALQTSHEPPWAMRNGFALGTYEGLVRAKANLLRRDASGIDALRQRVQVGIQWDMQVTLPGARHGVSHVLCSALPVALCRNVPKHFWDPLAPLVLEAAYEATLLAAVLTMGEHHRPIVYLTHVGGGMLGNDPAWIEAAMLRAMVIASGWALDVRVVAHNGMSRGLMATVAPFMQR